jgi:hypothetical protein
MSIVERSGVGGRLAGRAERTVRRANETALRPRADTTLDLRADQVVDDSPDTLLLGVDQIVGNGRKHSPQRRNKARAATGAGAGAGTGTVLGAIRAVIAGDKADTGGGGALGRLMVVGRIVVLIAVLSFVFRIWESPIWPELGARLGITGETVEADSSSTGWQPATTGSTAPATSLPPPVPASRIPLDSLLRQTNMGGALRVEEIIFSGQTCSQKLADRLYWPIIVATFDCDCFFGILYEEQVSVAYLPASDKVGHIVSRARAHCGL